MRRSAQQVVGTRQAQPARAQSGLHGHGRLVRGGLHETLEVVHRLVQAWLLHRVLEAERVSELLQRSVVGVRLRHAVRWLRAHVCSGGAGAASLKDAN